MRSPESNIREDAPLPIKAERNPYGYVIFFPTTDAAREAVGNFWSKVAPDIKDMIDSGRVKPEEQITGGPRTEFVPVKKERKDEGYQAAVYFSGNGADISALGLEALIGLFGYFA